MGNNTDACFSLEYSISFIFLASASAISGVICVIGNTIVIWTIYKIKTIQNVSHLLICSLACADCVVGILLNPILTVKVVFYSYIHYTHQIQPVLKTIDDFLWIQGLLVSTFSLAAISVDRYIAITRGIYYNTIMTIRQCKKIIIFAWVFPTFIASFRIFLTENSQKKWLWLTTILLAFVLPLIVTSFCYVKIFKSASEQAKRIDADKIRNTKAAKTMAVVLSVFIVTYLPSIIIACIHAFKDMDDCDILQITKTSWQWASCIAYASSAANPWIYSMRMTAFRQATKKAFGLQHNNTTPQI